MSPSSCGTTGKRLWPMDSWDNGSRWNGNLPQGLCNFPTHLCSTCGYHRPPMMWKKKAETSVKPWEGLAYIIKCVWLITFIIGLQAFQLYLVKLMILRIQTHVQIKPLNLNPLLLQTWIFLVGSLSFQLLEWQPVTHIGSNVSNSYFFQYDNHNNAYCIYLSTAFFCVVRDFLSLFFFCIFFFKFWVVVWFGAFWGFFVFNFSASSPAFQQIVL